MTATRISLGRLAAGLAVTALVAALLPARSTGAAESAATTDSVADDSALAAENGGKPFPYPLALKGPKPAPVTAPSDSELATSISRGVNYLLESQHKNGAWGGPQRTKSLNIYAPVPGSHLAFRTGVTGLAIEALLAARPLFDADKQKEIDGALDRAQAWMLKESRTLRRAEPDGWEDLAGMALYNVWGHAYAIHGILPLHDRAANDPALQAKLVDLLKFHVERLKQCTFVNGGWGYYDEVAHTMTPSGSPTSFTTATALIALKNAERLGAKYPEALAKKGTDSILRQRYPDFSYAYGEYLRMFPRMDINRPGGSLGRSQVCNLCLRMYGDPLVTDGVLRAWLDRLFARNGWLSIGRKFPVPHESHFNVAGYFYYYGHYYAGLCIEQLPAAERPYFQDHLARILLPLQEKDGSWWDYPLYDYHQAWGTAMAVSTLVRCRHGADVAKSTP